MPGNRANLKNEKQYEALKDKGMSKERAGKIANSPDAPSHGGRRAVDSDRGTRVTLGRRSRRRHTMSSTVRRITLFAVAALLVGLVAWPAAARESAQVRINRGGSSLLQDGTARIALRARCDANLAAFELDVTVQQGTVTGEASTVQAGVVTCDGAWHRVNVVVVPTSGAFSGGRAQVFVFLGVFDQDAGDLEARASGSVRL